MPKVIGQSRKISVISFDSIEAALVFRQNDADKVAILNFADSYRHGGYPYAGLTTQEEEICRRSNLYYALQTAYDHGMYPLEVRRAHEYYTGFYVENVSIIADIDFSPLDKLYNVDVITMAALDLTKQRTPTGKPVKAKDYIASAMMRGRIRSVLQVAAQKRVSVLVLGAWGSGAFKHDPAVIAPLFKEIILEEFDGVFEKIVFAISGPGKAADSDNLAKYKQTFADKFNVNDYDGALLNRIKDRLTWTRNSCSDTIWKSKDVAIEQHEVACRMFSIDI